MNAPGGAPARATRTDGVTAAGNASANDGVSVHEPDARSTARAHTPEELVQGIRDAARALGFAGIGFSPVERFERGQHALERWLGAGYHGEMGYLARGPDRSNPAELFARARTLIVVALPHPRFRSAAQPSRKSLLMADVAAYAQGRDYHLVLKEKLRNLADACATLAGRPVWVRPCVDSAPLLEREAAARAGVGFIAKSTLTIVPGLGSHVLLGELLIDLELPADLPMEPRCGSCRACLDHCPTGAFVDAYVLDARRCISYLTIEHKGAIPRELRRAMGQRIFGCDACQVVCPFNASPRDKPACPELEPRAELEDLSLLDLLELTSSGYRRLVQHSAMRRVSRVQLMRNAAVALGNSGDRKVVPRLVRALETSRHGLVRAHLAWALGQLGGADAERALTQSLDDADPLVAEEARVALDALNP